MSGLAQLDIWHDPSSLHLARPVADMIRAAGAAPHLRSGDFTPVKTEGLIILLGPSPTSRCWLDEQWIETVFTHAAEQQIPILPICVEDCDVPEALSHLSFADFINRDRETEELRVLIRLAEIFGADRICVPKLASDIPTSPPLHAVRLRYGAALDQWINRRFADEQLPMMQDGLFYELGVPFPAVHLEPDADLPQMAFAIDLFDVEEIVEVIPTQAIFVNAHPDDLSKAAFLHQPARNPASGHLHAWVHDSHADILMSKGLTTFDTVGWMILRLSALLRNRASTFLDQTTVAALLEALRPYFPRLVDTTMSEAISLAGLTDVLRRLSFEGVSIRNLRRILIEIAAYEDRSDILVDYLRAALKDQVTHACSRGQDHVAVILIDPALENRLHDATVWGETSSWIDLEPSEVAPLLNGLSNMMERLPPGVQAPMILTSLEIRAAVRRLIAPSFPIIQAIAYSDLEPNITIQPIGRIGLEGVEFRSGVSVTKTEL